MMISSLTREQAEFVQRVTTFEALLSGQSVDYCEVCDLFSASPVGELPDRCSECGTPEWLHRPDSEGVGYFGSVYGARLWPRDHGGMPLSIPEACSFLPSGGGS